MTPKLINEPTIQNVIPSSVGSRADLEADVNIAKVFGGYFSNPEVAKFFIDLGLKNIENELPKIIAFADYGGGQGFLTKFVADWLKSQGHEVDALVVDSNPKYLQASQKEGLRICQSNLESCDIKELDLIIMRAVMHYNSPEKQAQILENIYNSLRNGAFFISQLSAGSEANCRLRSEIKNLSIAESVSNDEKYHWISLEEYVALLKKAGFVNNVVTGYAPSGSWTPEEQWNRSHEKEMEKAVEINDTEKIESINAKKRLFIKQAYSLIDLYVKKYGEKELDLVFNQKGEAVISYKYPIIRSKKYANKK